MEDSPVIELSGVTKIYRLESGDVIALDNISFTVREGEFLAIMGASGSGKSTLLNQLGILDLPTSGELFIDGKNVSDLTDLQRTHIRRDIIGYIFQKFYLIPLLTAYENVEYPLILKSKKRDKEKKAQRFLDETDIPESLAVHKPSQLSGGQQQRVAIARALVNDPKILLCDEPTGNLDKKTGGQIMDLLVALHKKGKTIIFVTHDPNLTRFADRIITIEDGRIASVT